MRSFSVWIGIAATGLVGGAAHGALPVLTTHTVITTADSGPGSLREAINDSVLDSTDSLIDFQLPGPGPHTIQLQTPLPVIPENTRIDGSSALGASGEPMIEIDGSLAGDTAIGFQLTSANCQLKSVAVINWGQGAIRISGPGSCSVRGCFVSAGQAMGLAGVRPAGGPVPPDGLVISNSFSNTIGGPNPGDGNVISNNGDRGILIATANGNAVVGNRIGTDWAGTTALPNAVGIQIGDSAQYNSIGGGDPSMGNLISGNTVTGIMLTSGANTVTGNIIGLAADGVTPLGNGTGIYIGAGATANLIGGAGAPYRNLIAGSQVAGIQLDGAGTGDMGILGNYIGTDVTGMTAVSNHIGILLTNGATQVSVGGPTAAQGNLISGNIQAGIRLEASGNTVRGNIIGMAADGMTRLGNGLGVYIASGSNNLIGGQSPLAQGQGSPELGAGNLISGNSFEGIEVDSDNNTLLGNVVGLAADGVTAAGNGYGISVYRAANNRIGDSLPGHRNVISANYFYGISVLEFGADGTRIWGNHIGTDVTGTRLVGNLGEGITVSNAYSTQIGGASPEDGNVIAGNGSGVVIHSRTGNLVRNNSIYANAGLGIDLDGDGITPNDPDDSDTGGNGLQNFPILHEAHFEAVPPRISGEFTSAPNTMYTLEFFVSDAPDPSGNGEGQRLLASGPLTLGASGSVEFQTTLTPPLPAGRYVTATATDPDGNTSEFSPWIRASGRVPTTEEIVEVLLGIIPDPGDLDLNTSGGVEAGDVVTSVNTTNH